MKKTSHLCILVAGIGLLSCICSCKKPSTSDDDSIKERTCECVDAAKSYVMFADKKSTQTTRCNAWATDNNTTCTVN